jgi:type II secretory pathway pseudopilin PulG
MKKITPQSGMAMLLVMMSVIVVAGILSVAMARVQKSKSGTDQAVREMVLEEAAQSGIDLVTKKLWRDYINSSGNTTRNWASYRTYLTNTLAIPINEDLNGNGTLDPGEDGNGNGKLDRPTGGGSPYGKEMLNAPHVIKDPNTGAELASIDSVTISRFDNLQNAWLTVRSTARIGERTKTAVQVLEIGAPTRNHAQFAILANNVSCILCHAEIRSLPLETNSQAANYGSFDRVKVASLESVLVRKDEANSNIAGTLYTRGKVLQQNFSPYTAAQLASSTLKSYQHSTVNGKIVQNSTGAMTKVPLANAGKNTSGDLNQFANLYLDYPLDEHGQTDGPVPNTFPAPYPDLDEDNVVDDDEFQQVINTAQGKISFDSGGNNQGGAIKTGTAFGVKSGVYSGTTLPTSSTSDAVNELQTGRYNGHLILVGTQQDPISIDGTVAVNGDLVIKGYVKGSGQIMVKGNAYIMGDVVYKDGTKFGVAPDGKENAFALVAGGNIMMGDYLTVRGVNHSGRNSEQFPNWEKYSIDVRTKNVNGSETMKIKNKNVTETIPYGYFDKYSVDANDLVSGRPGDQFSFTMSELQLFNMMELNRAKADSKYKPRFYGLRSSQPNNIWVFDSAKGNNQEHAVKYSYPGVYKLSNYISTFGLPSNILSRATFQYLNPTNNWISENTLRQIWYEDEMSRPSSGGEVKFDGLLYSNNSIFTIVRSKTRHKSNTNGRMTIRGGVIAADLGIFVPEGLRINYDPRVERFIELRDPSVVSFMRTAFYFEDPQDGGNG